MEFILTKYKNQWSIFSVKTRCYVLFGPKKRLIKRLNELNKRS